MSTATAIAVRATAIGAAISVWAVETMAEQRSRRDRQRVALEHTRRSMVAMLAGLMVVLAGCGSSPAATAQPPAATTRSVPVFDVWAVRATFTDGCQGSLLDETFCRQVLIDEMSDADDILYVPTTLDRAMDDRASVICGALAVAHFDAEGRDLGYRFIVVRDMNGGNLAACRVDQR